MTPRERMKAAAECNFTAEAGDIRACGSCTKKLKPDANVYFFPDAGESEDDVYVGDCCVNKFLPAK